MVHRRPARAARRPGRRTAARYARRAARAGHRRTGSAATAPAAARGRGTRAPRARSGSRRRWRRRGPGSNRRMSKPPRSASMSGSSARLPSGNQRASPVRKVRGISHGPPCVPATSSRQPSSGHRVHRDPGAHARAVHVVVRLVLVPRGALAGPALLHQHVIVVEADLRGEHQRGRDRGTRECRASSSMPGISCQRQKSSVNAPGSPGPLATWASGPGLGQHRVDRAAAAAATSSASSTDRTHTTPSRANVRPPALPPHQSGP